MKFLKQLSLILFFYIIGELISHLIRLIIPTLLIPGSLIGMLLLFILLITKVIKFDWIDTVSDFFLKNMAFFFIPSVVSLMAYFEIITPSLWKLFIILFTSFVITFFFVGLSVKLTLRIMSKKGDKI